MKKLIFLILLFSNFFGQAQYTLIPDANFEQALISLGIDSGTPDGRVLTANVSGLTSLGVAAANITNLTGIPDFINLTDLECSRNILTSLNVTKNTALKLLNCWGNNLTSLDLSKNTSLTYLSCFQNELTSLDISKNTLMSQLYCSWNKLTSLNLKNGNNKDLFALNAFNNPNLSCIQVDNEAFSNSWDPSDKDATASYSKNCNAKVASIAPPVITATGNQAYCPGTSLPIVESVSITSDPLEPTTNTANIQISSGYVSGQDLLSLSGTNPGIGATWIPSEGKLNLYSTSGNLPYATFETAIKNVMYSNSSTSPSGTRKFSISLGTGQLSYLPSNKHFYEYVPKFGITWTAAKAAAAARTYYGLQGYLATLTSAAEAQLAGAQAPGAGWIGGTDISTPNVWKWVTGPEGLVNGGTGTVFWNGGSNGTTPTYANWNSGEPNNPNTEFYAHIVALGTPGAIPGSWNNLQEAGDPGGYYQAKGYIVEYGGMPGDPILNISTSTTMTMAIITLTTPSPICASSTTTLQASSTTGTINWYDKLTGGDSLGTDNSFTTPPLYTTTNFYIDNGCSPRTPIKVIVNSLPVAPTANDISYCQNEAALLLAATASANCTLNWYTAATGGTSNHTSPTPITTTAGITSYFVSQTITATGCEGPRSEIKVTVNPLPLAPLVSDVYYCLNTAATPLNVNPSANCTLNWYTGAIGGISSSTAPIPSTAFTGTTSYFVSQTTASGCQGTRAEIKVTVNPLPLAPIVSDVSYCINTTATPLNVNPSANCALNWYTSAIDGTASSINPTPSTAIIGTTSYFVSQTIIASGCEGPRTEIKIVVNPLPIVNDITITQCDTDSNPDGKTLFNLTVNNNLISTNFTNENFTYYTSQTGADSGLSTDLISNDLAFENTTPSTMEVWARVANKITSCYSTAKITLKVPATNLLSTYKIPDFTVCDDYLDAVNNDRDGIATFDFLSTKATIINQLPSNQSYTINYYRNKADALSQLNPITNISNYRNIGYPNAQNIWVRIESSLDNACVGLGPYITLKVEALPIANPVIIPRQCDDNQYGIVTFDTSSLELKLLNGQMFSDVTVTYFDQNNNPLPSPFPNTFVTKSQIIKAVVTNNTVQKCFDETTIQFIVDVLPQAFAVSPNLTTTCDDETDPLTQDGKFGFDTSTFEATILGTQKNMKVTYTLQDGTILSTLPNPFVTGTQNVIVTVINPANQNCTATTPLNFVVNPTPKINLNTNGGENELICSNLPTFFVTLDAGIQDGSPISNYTYIWSKNGSVLIDKTASTLPVNEEGTYTVQVTNNFGCSKIRTLKVTASNKAAIDTIEIIDLTDINTITVNVTGPGKYEYSLDEPSGFWQDSNFFNNVPAGIHDVYVNDKNGCGVVSQTIAVIGAPKFFTPNNDGYNDYWSIKGVTATFNSKSIIYIFDRYGKLIKQWVPNSNQGWDGTYNGAPMPSDDYWFTLKLEDGREAKGHFSLKR